MTEIPEHLLRRSRERRAALGLGGDAGAGDEPSEGAATPARAETATQPAAATPAKGAGAAVPAVPEVVDQPPTYIAPPQGPHKLKVPLWVMPVLVSLPLWAFLYPGAFSNHKKAIVSDPLTVGAGVYRSAGCSTCHGAGGEGGVGPALHGGASVKTFPAVADQVEWVRTGSTGKAGQLYGDPNRAGGQAGPAKGDMPGFAGSLSATQITDVVLYERTRL